MSSALSGILCKQVCLLLMSSVIAVYLCGLVLSSYLLLSYVLLITIPALATGHLQVDAGDLSRVCVFGLSGGFSVLRFVLRFPRSSPELPLLGAFVLVYLETKLQGLESWLRS